MTSLGTRLVRREARLASRRLRILLESKRHADAALRSCHTLQSVRGGCVTGTCGSFLKHVVLLGSALAQHVATRTVDSTAPL